MRIGEIERIGEREVPGWDPIHKPEPLPPTPEKVPEKEPIKEPEKVS